MHGEFSSVPADTYTASSHIYNKQNKEGKWLVTHAMTCLWPVQEWTV